MGEYAKYMVGLGAQIFCSEKGQYKYKKENLRDLKSVDKMLTDFFHLFTRSRVVDGLYFSLFTIGSGATIRLSHKNIVDINNFHTVA